MSAFQAILIVTIGMYGECEFIFASIKVITIVGLIILGIVLDLGGGPNHDRIGFRYWKNPGPFVQFDHISGTEGRFLGWWSVMTQAAFSFIGTEIVAVSRHIRIVIVVRATHTRSDRSRRSQESEAKSPKGDTACVHSNSPLLHWRCHHHWSSCPFIRPRLEH